MLAESYYMFILFELKLYLPNFKSRAVKDSHAKTTKTYEGSQPTKDGNHKDLKHSGPFQFPGFYGHRLVSKRISFPGGITFIASGADVHAASKYHNCGSRQPPLHVMVIQDPCLVPSEL